VEPLSGQFQTFYRVAGYILQRMKPIRQTGGPGHEQDKMKTEQDAIADLRAGNFEGLAFLVQRHQIRALRTAYLIVGSRAAAEDIVQEVFIRLAERIDQFDNTRSFEPWLLRSVVHEALKTAECQRRLIALDLETDDSRIPSALCSDPEAGPEAQIEQAEQRRSVQAALNRLPLPQRAAVVMRYYLDMDERSISRVLNTPPGTIRWRLHMGLRRLRALLGA
jgi:RNA polymerase sigma-70 factor (ECF subfamily)